MTKICDEQNKTKQDKTTGSPESFYGRANSLISAQGIDNLHEARDNMRGPLFVLQHTLRPKDTNVKAVLAAKSSFNIDGILKFGTCCR